VEAEQKQFENKNTVECTYDNFGHTDSSPMTGVCNLFLLLAALLLFILSTAANEFELYYEKRLIKAMLYLVYVIYLCQKI